MKNGVSPGWLSPEWAYPVRVHVRRQTRANQYPTYTTRSWWHCMGVDYINHPFAPELSPGWAYPVRVHVTARVDSPKHLPRPHSLQNSLTGQTNHKDPNSLTSQKSHNGENILTSHTHQSSFASQTSYSGQNSRASHTSHTNGHGNHSGQKGTEGTWCRSYRGTSHTRKRLLLGPFRRTMHRTLWWSNGGPARL